MQIEPFRTEVCGDSRPEMVYAVIELARAVIKFRAVEGVQVCSLNLTRSVEGELSPTSATVNSLHRNRLDLRPLSKASGVRFTLRPFSLD